MSTELRTLAVLWTLFYYIWKIVTKNIDEWSITVLNSTVSFPRLFYGSKWVLGCIGCPKGVFRLFHPPQLFNPTCFLKKIRPKSIDPKKNFDPKLFLAKTFFKNFLTPKNVWLKFFLTPKNFLSQNFFVWPKKNFLPEIFFDPKIFFDQKFFLTKNLFDKQKFYRNFFSNIIFLIKNSLTKF